MILYVMFVGAQGDFCSNVTVPETLALPRRTLTAKTNGQNMAFRVGIAFLQVLGQHKKPLRSWAAIQKGLNCVESQAATLETHVSPVPWDLR